MGALDGVSKISPPNLQMILSDAIYVRDIVDPLGFNIGLSRIHDKKRWVNQHRESKLD